MAFYRDLDEKEKRGGPDSEAWPELGSVDECETCGQSPSYRVLDTSFPDNPVKRYYCPGCFERWVDRQRPGSSGKYRFTFKLLAELREEETARGVIDALKGVKHVSG